MGFGCCCSYVGFLTKNEEMVRKQSFGDLISNLYFAEFESKGNGPNVPNY